MLSNDALAQLRLMQLVSPSLPVGAYSYSQGLEWAVEAHWIPDEDAFVSWLQGLLLDGLAHLDLPILKRLTLATHEQDYSTFARWGDTLLAYRETRELREEEHNRARAMTRLLIDLDCQQAKDWQNALLRVQAAPFAIAGQHWQISVDNVLLGYAYGWLENQIAAAIKLVPLGQTAGQRVLQLLAPRLVEATQFALQLDDTDIGASAPAQALASCQHETQYTRLFRS